MLDKTIGQYRLYDQSNSSSVWWSVRIPFLVNFVPRIDDVHCGRIHGIHSLVIADHIFHNGYVCMGEVPVAVKECCA